jgi:soluble lytic murein transglycosylase-like protein
VDILTDMAAVSRRITEITEQPMQAAASFAAPASSFTSMVNAAMGDPAAQRADLERLVNSNANAWGVDPALVKAIIANESGFDPNATSTTGARGLMQLEPGTAAELGVGNAYDPAQNIWGGTRYVRGLLERFHGDLRLAIAAYNAGPGAVEKYGGVPPYAETQAYVENVLDSYRRYKTQ